MVGYNNNPVDNSRDYLWKPISSLNVNSISSNKRIIHGRQYVRLQQL